MTPEEIKALRRELGCSARELSTALGVEQETVLAWERAELFPTKRLVSKMDELRALGPSAVPKQRRKGGGGSPMQVMASPELWMLVRKLAVHAELRAAVIKLAEAYSDPAEE
jgi:transcriptional regulator with XRE-family HTH domain